MELAQLVKKSLLQEVEKERDNRPKLTLQQYQQEKTQHDETTAKLTKSSSENAEREKRLQDNIADLSRQARNATSRAEEIQNELSQLTEKNKEEINRLTNINQTDQKNIKILQTRITKRGDKIKELKVENSKLDKRPDISQKRYQELLEIENNRPNITLSE